MTTMLASVLMPKGLKRLGDERLEKYVRPFIDNWFTPEEYRTAAKRMKGTRK